MGIRAKIVKLRNKEILKRAIRTYLISELFYLFGIHKIRSRKWNGIKIKFLASSRFERRRVFFANEKEPKTVEWINNFDKGDVLWDIGANIGIFSLYAAKKNFKVVAFEPVFHNFYSLNMNIEINDLNEKITAYPISIHNSFNIDHLSVHSMESGTALSQFSTPDNENIYKQGSIGFSVDELEEHLPFPNHIKIDVDGNEKLIVQGMKSTMKDKRLKSVLIEIGEDAPWFRKVFKQDGFISIDQKESSNHIFKRKRS